MPDLVEIRLLPEVADDPLAHQKAIADKLGIGEDKLPPHHLVRKSVDARRLPVCLQFRYAIGSTGVTGNVITAIPSTPRFPTSPSRPIVVIIGMGPAGLFAGLRLLELGIRPVFLERGKDASRRRFDLAPIFRRGEVIPDSNYCFGEGGAGTFSDGKLYTRSVKRGDVGSVLKILARHGAPNDILVDAHPHIGSNLLPKVIMAIRATLIAGGAEVHFESRMTELVKTGKGAVIGAVDQHGREFTGQAVLLATGHSARDIFAILERERIRLEEKPFAVGVRVEHPQPLIDANQYHCQGPRPRALPAASYRLAVTRDGRGVFSFCMCPGGFIVPASTHSEEIVINGMSLSRRDSPYANSGMVVSVLPADLAAFGKPGDPWRGVHLQRSLEELAFRLGGGAQKAPGQRIADFLNGKVSQSLPPCSYRPGVEAVNFAEVLPASFANALLHALPVFARQIRGFTSEEGIMVGFETRTSCPIRIPRDPDTGENPDAPGLFPCGEGAGYAGGIVSAALDGRAQAEAIALKLGIEVSRTPR